MVRHKKSNLIIPVGLCVLTSTSGIPCVACHILNSRHITSTRRQSPTPYQFWLDCTLHPQCDRHLLSRTAAPGILILTPTKSAISSMQLFNSDSGTMQAVLLTGHSISPPDFSPSWSHSSIITPVHFWPPRAKIGLG